jgi:hypothetical protein
MVEEIPSLALIYPASCPDDALREFLDVLSAQGLVVPVRRDERGPSAGLEWLLPTAAFLFVSRSFFESFLKKAGEDAYDAFKRAMAQLWPVFFGTEPRVRVRVVASAPGKLARAGFSRAFSIIAKADDGRSIKLLLRDNATSEELNESVSAFVRFLEDVYAGSGPPLTYVGGVAVVAYDAVTGTTYFPDVHAGQGGRPPRGRTRGPG